jgi:hypothetical protein
MGVNGCLIGLKPYRVANIVARGNRPPELASGFHTNFRMEKLDAHQNLRLLRRAVSSPTSRVPDHSLLFGTGLSTRETTSSSGDKRQDADGPRLP